MINILQNNQNAPLIFHIIWLTFIEQLSCASQCFQCITSINLIVLILQIRKLRCKKVKKIRYVIYLVDSDQDSNLDYVVLEPGLLADTL